MSTSALAPSQSLVQNLKFSGSESEYATEIRGQVINILCSEGGHNHGSSKVKLTDRIDYNWEFKYYHGHLVAAHINGKIIAYAMKGKDGGMIRVAHQDTNGKRALIKNLKEDIKDLAFAYSRSEIILGCIDCERNILIYNIEDGADSLNYTLLLHVFREEPVRPKTNFRLIWCPYLPSYDDDGDDSDHDDPEKMFVVLNGMRAEVYNVAMINSKYGNEGTLEPDESYEGYIEINHTSDLVDAAFSSDGTAIAIACQDGYVKFFQLYMFDTEKQKCLHEWQPHEGSPLTSIIFIDNILEYSSECWKFTITGANNNSEIKLWSCETWTCLQTINFLPNMKGVIPDLFLNISIDYTGQYLVISDINNRGIYIMQLKRNDEEQLVCVTLLSHFLLPAPFLSFHILEACTKNVPCCYNNSTEDLYDNDDDFDEEVEITVLGIKMMAIQPKKFQECTITFQPESLMYKGLTLTENIVEELVDLKNGHSQDETIIEKIPELDDLQNSVTLLIQQQQQSNSKLTLMTPDDFTSPGKNSKSSSVRNSITNENALNDQKDIAETEFQRPQKDNFASAGSSPSREVQEILSLNNSTSGYPTQEYFNNLANLQDEEEHPQKDYSAPTESTLLYQDAVNWPKIPLVKDTEIIKQINEATNNDINKQDLETVYIRINTLENMIREQKVLMQQLHQDMKSLNQTVVKSAKVSTEKEEYVKELDAAMSKQHLQIAKMLENLVQLQKVKDREMQEQLISAVGQIISKSVSDKIQQIVTHEIKHAVLPTIHQSTEAYMQRIDSQYSHKFANIDSMVKENFAKVISSKSLTDSISVSVVNLIAPTLEKCYRDIIAQSLVPSWERVCGQMFQQINETFTKGTKEYTASVESYMDRQRRVQDKGKDLITQMQAVSENMKGNAEKLSDILSSEMHKQFNSIFKSMQDKLLHSVKDIVSQEVKQGFKSHAAIIEEGVINAVRSRAVTPALHADSHLSTMAQIQQSLNKQLYDEAFQIALTAENLNLVIFVCERVDVNKVFGEKCMLSQSVLLALMQQLSMEMHKTTEIKLSFIRAAFLALTPESQQTKHFIPKVLRELLKQLNAFMDKNPPLKQMTEARLLKMAVESMLGK